MAVDLIVTYKAEVDQLTQQLKIVADRLDAMEKQSQEAAKGLDQTAKSADKLDKELSSMGSNTGKATQGIKNFAKTTETELNKLSQKVNTIGRDIAIGLGAAFGVQEVINFGKASVNAFIEAQKNAEKLRFSVTQIQRETEAAFERLIAQSEELQKISIFSDDSIQQAQAALSTFGLTADQIEQVIPVLADFATLTGQDIPQAAQALGQAIQGRAGEFKRFGIDVKETNTEVENLNIILKGLENQAGAAGRATQTMAGQIEQARNQVDDFQETLGQGIIAYFTTFVNNVRPAVEAVIENIRQLFALFRSGADDTDKASDALSTLDTVVRVITFPVRLLFGAVELVTDGILLLARTAKGTAAAIQVAFQQIGETVTNVGSGVAKVFDGLLSFDSSKINQAVSQIKQPIKNFGAEISKAFNEGFKLDITEQVQKGTGQVTKSETNLLNRLELKKKTIEELNALLLENQKINNVNGRSNVQLINLELEARKKLSEQLKKNADVRKAGSEEEIKLINRIEAEYSDLVKLLSDPDKAQLLELSITAELDPAAFKEQIAKLVVEGAKSINEDFEAELNKKNKERVDSFTKANDVIVDDTKASYEEILSESTQLIDSIQSLNAQFTANQLAEIDRRKQAELDSLTAQEEALQEKLDKRRLSETEAQRLSEQLTEKRLQTEKRAADKERALKRKQFEIDKAAALIKIAINTAVAVTENLGVPVLAALIAVAGAAEAATVAAQPNPYKKGSKNTKQGLARVGEEGEEIVFMPRGAKVLPAKQTKTYGEALDAMFDNRFDKWVIDNYAPRLVQQQKTHTENERKSFSKNLAESLTVNVASPAMRRSEKVSITNVDELAEVMSLYMKRSVYR